MDTPERIWLDRFWTEETTGGYFRCTRHRMNTGAGGDIEYIRVSAVDAEANAAPDPALRALAKLGAMVLDWSPLECGFPTIPGGVIDDMAVRSGCALEDASDGGHECWTAPGVRLAIAALLAPDQREGVQG